MQEQEQEHEQEHVVTDDTHIITLEKVEKGEKGEKIQNEIQNEIPIQKLPASNLLPLDINSFDVINYITLETMSNNDSYNKYLKRNKMDHDAVLKREKKFYRKRIIALTKDILFNNVNHPSPNTPEASQPSQPPKPDVPKIDDVIISAFNNYARLCISYFKFKDTMDTIQGEYKDMNQETYTDNKNKDTNTIDDEDHNHDDKNENISNHLNEANKLCMKQTDKKILTLDNYVVKTSAPKKEMILPKTKNVNLKDPKFKKKDIKVSVSMSMSTSAPTLTPTTLPTTIQTTN